MRKYLFVFVLSSTFLIASPAYAQTNSDKEAIKELNNKITEIEEEIEELSNVDDLKSEMNDSLLNREKSLSDNLYTFLIVFVSIISFFAAVGGAILGYLVIKLGKHQKKIDLVMDSKDFDDKLEAMEQRFITLRMKERLSKISLLKTKFKTASEIAERYIGVINHTYRDESFKRINEKYGMEEVLQELDWDSVVAAYEEEKVNFSNLLDTEISPEDDENSTDNVEDLLAISLNELKEINERIGHVLEYTKNHIDKVKNGGNPGELNNKKTPPKYQYTSKYK